MVSLMCRTDIQASIGLVPLSRLESDLARLHARRGQDERRSLRALGRRGGL